METVMCQKILQVNLKFSGLSRSELEQAWLPAARPIADSNGLRWKIWLMNEHEHEAGGIYLFDDEVSVQAFLAGPILASLKSDPSISDIRVKMFEVLEQHTAVTRGPVRQGFRV